MRQSVDLFTNQQEAIRQQMHKILAGTPLDVWLKVGEQNMQAWQKMQQSILQGLQPKDK